jgi:hypothetical protein
MLKRITKREAQKRFYEGTQPIILCPRKCYYNASYETGYYPHYYIEG